MTAVGLPSPGPLPEEPSPRPRMALKRARRVAEVLAQEILRDITERGLEPGTPLPTEAELLKTYEVGRASLREALLILQVHGMVARRGGRNGGSLVVGLDASAYGRMSQLFFSLGGATVEELVLARSVIAPTLARLAAQCTDEAAKQRLVELSATPEPLDERGYLAARHAFHKAISTMTGNTVLGLLAGSLDDIVNDQLHEALVPAHGWALILRKQARTAKAIADGDGDAAEARMHEVMDALADHARRHHPQAFRRALEWS